MADLRTKRFLHSGDYYPEQWLEFMLIRPA